MNDTYTYNWGNVFNLMKISIQNIECLAQFSIKNSKLIATDTTDLISGLTTSINAHNSFGAVLHTVINNTETTIHNYQKLFEQISELNSQACHEAERNIYNFERSLKLLATQNKKPLSILPQFNLAQQCKDYCAQLFKTLDIKSTF